MVAGGEVARSSFDAASSIKNLSRRTGRYPRLSPCRETGARGGNSDSQRSAHLLAGTRNREVEESVQVVHHRCCGLDVHKKTVVACVLTAKGKQTRTFGTTTRELLELADWLAEGRISHVAMESTGIYWMPLYNLLEGQGLELLVVNARHIKAVPGRKTDVKDAEWIADLLRHGLLRGSFIPDRSQRELRELVRYRRALIDQRGDVVRRIHKLLEGANVKLSDVATHILGVSGRAMLQALVAGSRNPAELAGLARGRLKQKRSHLELALEGSFGAHQRSLLKHQLGLVEFLEQEITQLSVEIEDRMRPHEAAIGMIDGITGLGRRSAEAILAEIGQDMSRFPTDKHISSWAKVCPGNNESAGKRRSGAAGHGNPWLSSALVEAAWAAIRKRDSYFAAQYQRIAARRGKKRAIVAVAHSLLIVIYHMLQDGTIYQDLGANHFDHLNREAVARRSVRRLEKLGYKVTIQEAA